MKQSTKRVSALAAAVLLAISGSVYAQSSGTTGGTNAGTSPAPGAMQPGQTQTSPAAPAPGVLGSPSIPPTTGATSRMPTRSDNATTAFQALDPSKRGYVTRAETDRLDGFTGFDNADTNRDGQLSSEEFAKAWSTYGTR